MHIEVQVEEPSAEEVLKELLPKIIGDRASFRIINYRGKHNLLKQLPSRFRAYAARIERGEELKLAVLVDRDDDDCHALKERLERTAIGVGLTTKAAPASTGDFVVVNRLAIEELEAWFIGDAEAVRAAFPRVGRFEAQAPFRIPDGVHGTWEALHRLLERHGIYGGFYPKIDAARRIAPYMRVSTNRSESFQMYCAGMEALVTSDSAE